MRLLAEAEGGEEPVWIGILVLHQIPTLLEATGILLVAAGVALHKDSDP